MMGHYTTRASDIPSLSGDTLKRFQTDPPLSGKARNAMFPPSIGAVTIDSTVSNRTSGPELRFPAHAGDVGNA